MTPTEKKPSDGNGLYKIIVVAVVGILAGMLTQQIRQPTDLVHEAELTQHIVELQDKIDGQTKEIVALRASVNQQSVDIAGIAAKVGVTAHPVVAPNQ